MKLLKITWRDEAYGQWSSSSAAFRLYETANLSDSAVARIHGKARKAGFTFCQTRCAWIAWDQTSAASFVAGVEELGYEVAHEGRWPEGPSTQADASGEDDGQPDEAQEWADFDPDC